MSDAPIELVNGRWDPRTLEVVRKLRHAGFDAFLVGGCVRDLLLGRLPGDFDVATAAEPAEVSALFRKVIPTGVEHGTVTVIVSGHPVEVTTFRTESDYLDGRRPSKVAFHRDIEVDLSRRDFTVNAMAFDPVDQRFVDPFGGLADLTARRIRCVGRPEARFGEDGLRPLRAVRLATVLDFELDPPTEAAIPNSLEVFAKVARERVNVEFTKLLLAPRVDRGLSLLERTRLFGVFLPELLPHLDEARKAAVARAPRECSIRLAAVLRGLADARGLVVRLVYPNKVVDTVAALLAHPLPEVSASDFEVRAWMAAVGRHNVESALALAEAWALPSAAGRARVEAIRAGNPPLSTGELALRGKEIMEILAVPPSPRVGEAARHLLARVWEDPSANTPERLGELLRKWAKIGGGP